MVQHRPEFKISSWLFDTIVYLSVFTDILKLDSCCFYNSINMLLLIVSSALFDVDNLSKSDLQCCQLDDHRSPQSPLYKQFLLLYSTPPRFRLQSHLSSILSHSSEVQLTLVGRQLKLKLTVSIVGTQTSPLF